MSALRVVVDGKPLPDDEARTLWRRFSAWMSEHVGDLGGFARAEGFASVRPEMHGGVPVLVASRTEPQVPYGVAVRTRPESSPRSTRREISRKARPRRHGH
jgi:hypothetical protein